MVNDCTSRIISFNSLQSCRCRLVLLWADRCPRLPGTCGRTYVPRYRSIFINVLHSRRTLPSVISRPVNLFPLLIQVRYRLALFFSSASLSGAFSGLLAAAIQNMHGIGGKPGWAWIFILVGYRGITCLSILLLIDLTCVKEGLFTVIIGLTSFFLLPSTPQDSKFLTQRQKE